MTHPFDPIAAAQYVNFTTFRKNGERKATPIWVAVSEGRAYVWSQRDTWKVKRLVKNPACELTPCNVTGSKNTGATVAGKGRLLQPGETAVAKHAFKKKYGLSFITGEFFGRIRPGSDHVYIEIVPA
ncbi:MAG: PPOX class F420-dependent oxidoreductase [Myxococcales bacterium]|nr:PPOX class F420-dependent oxidoreductase [Myxococcales bacterium]MCB9629972.1 PPOX class F420-dependent oxidoreductase [Sandaracinaceae bacterium]